MLIDILLTIILIICLLIFLILNIILLPIAYILKFLNKNIGIYYASIVIKIMFLLIKNVLFITVDVEYDEELDKNKNYMYISNHRGNFDVILTYPYLNIGTFIVAKNSLKQIPILKQWMGLIDCYFLDRNDLRDGFAMIINSINKINDNWSLLLYPEGTRSVEENPSKLLEFKEGSFTIAKKTNVEVVPITIIDTSNILEKYGFIKTRKKIKIKFLKPELIEKIDRPGEYFKNKMENVILNTIVDN